MFRGMFDFLKGMFFPESQHYCYEEEHTPQAAFQEEPPAGNVYEAFLEDQMLYEISYDD